MAASAVRKKGYDPRNASDLCWARWLSDIHCCDAVAHLPGAETHTFF